MKKLQLVALLAVIVMMQSVAWGDAISDALGSNLTFTQNPSGAWQVSGGRVNYYYDADDNYCQCDFPYVATVRTSSSSDVTLTASSVSGPGVLSFICNSSSGTLSFYDNGVEVSGSDSSYNYNWCEKRSVSRAAGSHTFSWRWKSTSSYSYAGLAQVRWEPAPASCKVTFHPCDGLFDTVEETYETGKTYGSLPPAPTRAGYVFEGWYTMAYGGDKVEPTAYVDWERTDLYAHWSGGSLQAEFAGVSDTSAASDMSKWSFGNGMTIEIPERYTEWRWNGNQTEEVVVGEDMDAWIEAQIDGDAVLSFDWISSAVNTSEWASVMGLVDILVDGVSVRSRVLSQNAKDVYLQSSIYLDPEHGVWWTYFDYNKNCEASCAVRVYLLPGKHTVRWRVSNYQNRGAEAWVTIRNVKREPVGMEDSAFDLFKFIQEWKVLRPGNMAYLRDTIYGTRIKQNPNDYEARILRAMATLGALAENAKAREIIRQCGYAVADYTFRMTGEFVGIERAPLSNDVIDQMMPEILLAVDSALADLKAIPEDWTGRIEFVPEAHGLPSIKTDDWYKQDKVYIGLAEVSLSRALVEMLRAQLKLVKGYDFEADYVAVSNAVENAEYVHDVLAAAPKAVTIRSAADLLSAKEDFRAALASVRRADAAIVNRGDYATYLFEYDLADAEEIEACRTLLNQVEASLDATNVVDISYFTTKYDTNDVVQANIPGGDLAKQLFLGAVFAGKVTRDLVPNGFINRDTDRIYTHMQTISDPTGGGLLPWLTLGDIAKVYPWTQEWEMTSYLAQQPKVTLNGKRDFIVYCAAERNGNLSYATSVPGQIMCIRDWSETVAIDQVDTAVQRTIPAERGHTYSLHLVPDEKMAAAAMPISIAEAPTKLADGGPYTETVSGVEIKFEVVNGGAWIGTVGGDQGVSDSVSGDVTIPAFLGGWPVVGVRSYAFFRCKEFSTLTFLGDEPTVESYAFMLAEIGRVQVARFRNWPRPLPTTWQGFPIGYVAAMNPGMTVTPSRSNGRFTGTTSLALSAEPGCTIHYTLDGTEPTQSSPVYRSPLVLSETKKISFFAVEAATGDWGPVASVTLTRLPSEQASISVTPSVADGARFVGSLSVSLISGANKTVYYTTDGSDPKDSPSRQVYSGSIYMDRTTTLKYYAEDTVLGDWSPVRTAQYILRKPDGGPYSETINGQTWRYRIINGCASVGQIAPGYTIDDGYSSDYCYIQPIGSSSSSTKTYYSSIRALDRAEGAVEIPAELGGCPVTRISLGAFVMQQQLTSLSIPDTVVEIDGHAFFECSGLTGVHLPTSLQTLGEWAFSGCSALKAVTLPGSLQICGLRAFSGCSSLEAVVLFEGITEVADFLFYYCPRLQSVVLPSTLRVIRENAFGMCGFLREIEIPAGVQSIEQYAFYSCSLLSTVFFGGDAPNVPGDDYNIFGSNEPTRKIYVKKGTSGWGPVPGMWQGTSTEYVEDAVFTTEIGGAPWNYRNDGMRVSLLRQDNLTAAECVSGVVTIPSVVNGEPVQVLGKGLLQGAAKMTAVVVPDTVTEIAGSVFRECTQLRVVTLPEGLREIGDHAFRECVSLTDITIPSTVTNIGYFAFRDCLRLTNVTLRGAAPRRDLGAFMGVPSFTTISGRLGSATAIVYAAVTNSTPEITVPEGWLDEIAVAHDAPAGASSYQAAFVERFGSDLRAALTKPTGKFDLKGEPLYVWQDYVAGTDPLDEEDTFKATLTIEDGVPVVRWSPELPPEKAVRRKYTTYGATALDGGWTDVSGLTAAERQAQGYQFFRVTVEMR